MEDEKEEEEEDKWNKSQTSEGGKYILKSENRALAR